MTVRIVVADDQPLVRAGLAGILATAPDLVVVGEADTGRSAVEQVMLHHPDVVVMDVRMPDLDGIEATRRIVPGSGSRVLVLTTFDLDEYVYAALEAGASGFLLKDVPPAELISAVRVVAAGEALLAPRVTTRLVARFLQAGAALPGRPEPAEAAAQLLRRITEREHEVLLLVAEGLSNAEIGERLHITASTAKTHVAHLLTKLDARDRIHLVVLAFRSGLVRPLSAGPAAGGG